MVTELASEVYYWWETNRPLEQFHIHTPNNSIKCVPFKEEIIGLMYVPLVHSVPALHMYYNVWGSSITALSFQVQHCFRLYVYIFLSYYQEGSSNLLALLNTEKPASSCSPTPVSLPTEPIYPCPQCVSYACILRMFGLFLPHSPGSSSSTVPENSRSDTSCSAPWIFTSTYAYNHSGRSLHCN